MGPTATGKTDCAISLCKRFPCDVISVDSALVYRHMDIGTAKPDAETLRRTPHRLIDFLEPEQSYSAGEFVRDACREMDDISAAGRMPLLVGGTMMYFRALTQGIAKLPGADAAVRAAIDAEAEEAGWPAIHAQLQEVDPQAAARIKPNDLCSSMRACARRHGVIDSIFHRQSGYRSTGRTAASCAQYSKCSPLRLSQPSSRSRSYGPSRE